MEATRTKPEAEPAAIPPVAPGPLSPVDPDVLLMEVDLGLMQVWRDVGAHMRHLDEPAEVRFLVDLRAKTDHLRRLVEIVRTAHHTPCIPTGLRIPKLGKVPSFEPDDTVPGHPHLCEAQA